MNLFSLLLIISVIIKQNTITQTIPNEDDNGQCSLDNKSECRGTENQKEPSEKYTEGL